MTGAQRFPILFTGIHKAMAALGITQGNSWVDVSDSDVVVHMGWAFHAEVPRSSISSVAADNDRVLGWGAHGWKGRWLINGSSSNIVRVEIDPPAKARSIGFKVHLKVLRVSVEDPDTFQRALQSE